MKKQILFSEKQHFNQWWFRLIIFVLIGIPTLPLLIKGLEQHDNLQQIIAAINNHGFYLLVFIAIFMLSCRLDTQITNDGIRVRLFPFHLKFKYFPQNAIGLAYVKEYNPIGDYGGWGLRLGFFGQGKAYNISGNQGIQLVFKDGSKLLIGTQKPDEASAVLQQLGYLRAAVYEQNF